jgi:hypothetical protein
MKNDLLSRLQTINSPEERAWLVTLDLLQNLPSDLQSAAWAAAVPHWFNDEILSALLERSVTDCVPLYARLQRLPFVESYEARRACNVHEMTRTMMLNYLWRERLEDYLTLSTRAAGYFAQRKDPAWQIEHIYHSLVSDPIGVADIVEHLQAAWSSPFQYALASALAEKENELWPAIWQIWSASWRDTLPTDIEAERALRLLGLAGTPFGSFRAEADPLLFACRLDPPWSYDLQTSNFKVAVGPVGSGKTATALLLAYDNLLNQVFFPVYYSIRSEITTLRLQLDSIARVVSQTLLRYLALRPWQFLKRSVQGRLAIVRLSGHYVGTEKESMSLLYQAKAAPVGYGIAMRREIDRLTKDVSFTSIPTDTELLALMSAAYPEGFQRMMLLLDVQRNGVKDDPATSMGNLTFLYDLANRLEGAGVIVKTFLPDSFHDAMIHCMPQLSVETVSLHWSDRDLLNLLRKRLAHLGDDSLAAWCDLRTLNSEDFRTIDQRLVKAAKGTPGGLMAKGNELLRRIGQNQRRLSSLDLDDILGPTSTGKESE